jgi:hypothetical protein
MVKALKYLKESRARKQKEEIASIINEKQEYVNKALEKLVAIGVVREAEGFYSYVFTPHSDKFYHNLMEVYTRVNKKPSIELMVRGLFCEIPHHYLIHANTVLEILEGQGLDRKELNHFLEQEIENGYLRRIRVICLGMRPFSIPVYVPSYYLSHLRILGWEHYEGPRQNYQDSEFYEEDYLLARYPPELAAPARQYIETERRELKEKLRERGMAAWMERFL